MSQHIDTLECQSFNGAIKQEPNEFVGRCWSIKDGDETWANKYRGAGYAILRTDDEGNAIGYCYIDFYRPAEGDESPAIGVFLEIDDTDKNTLYFPQSMNFATESLMSGRVDERQFDAFKERLPENHHLVMMSCWIACSTELLLEKQEQEGG